MKLEIGLQLYSVRQALKKAPFETLEKVAEAGFTYVEAANHNAAIDDGVGFDLPAKELKRILSDLGLSIVGCHINPLKVERMPSVLDYHAELGNTQVGCDIEFFPHNDLDYVLRRCELFNKIGEMCKERGMRYYYHNHYQEFQTIGDSTVYDLIMEHTDSSLVYIEMDTYWMIRAGHDPISYIEKYKDRLVLLHQKDFPNHAPQPLNMFDGVVTMEQPITDELFTQTKDPRCFAEIGTGILPIREIMEAAEKAPHLKYVLLEQDHTQLDEIESIRVSRQGFRNLFARH